MRYLSGVIIVLVGVGIMLIFGMPLFTAWSSLQWNKVSAEKLDVRVTPCEISVARRPGQPGFEVKAFYSFVVNGKRFVSDCVCIVGAKFLRQEDADLACQKILKDRVVYYSNFFGRSCLIPGARSGRFLIGVGMGVLLCVLGVTLFLLPRNN